MNGLYQYKDPLAESYDDDGFDQESISTTAEWDPIGTVSSTIGGLLGGGPRRQPVSIRDHRAPSTTTPGVRDARLETPRGNATLRLPEEVVSKRVFDQTIGTVQESVTGLTTRLNTLEQKDLTDLKKDVGSLMASTRQAIADEKKARQKAMMRQSRALKSSQTTNLMMSLLFQRQLQTKLETHFHHGDSTVPVGSSADPASLDTGTDNTLMLLPLMMMGDGMGMSSDRDGDPDDSSRGDSSDNSMMMMVMMMTLLK